MKTVHTDCFAPKTRVILDKFRDYMLKEWGTCQMRRAMELTTIAEAPNGEIIFEFENTSWRFNRTPFGCNKSDKEIREWFALNLKLVVYRIIKSKIWEKNLAVAKVNSMKNAVPASADISKRWFRTSDEIVDKFSTDDTKIRIKDIYCLYEKLYNRSRFSKNWPKEMIDSIIGQEKDAVQTELEIARREEHARLSEEFKRDCEELEVWRSKSIEDFRFKIEKEYNEKRRARRAQYEKALQELDESLSFTTELPSFLA